MRALSLLVALFATISLVFGFAQPAFADDTTFSISGVVTTPSGKPAKAVSVRLDSWTGFLRAISTASDGSYRFDSRGWGHPETTANGGMILYYHNTSSIRFDMFGTTYPGIPPQNLGIFAAWDGNLGVNGGGTTGFGGMVVVPEPGVPVLLGAAAAGLLLRRGRQSGNA